MLHNKGEQREMSAGISFIQWMMMFSFLITLSSGLSQVKLMRSVHSSMYQAPSDSGLSQMKLVRSVHSSPYQAPCQWASRRAFQTRSAGSAATAAQRGCTDRTIGHKVNR